jgi:integrase
MKNPNGYGSVYKLSGKRRKPFIIRKTIGFDDNAKQIYQIIGYYEKRDQAMLALAEYNKNPLILDNEKITFEEVFVLWKAKKFDGATTSTINGYNAAYKNSPVLHDMKFKDIKTMHMDKAISNCNLGHGSLRKMKILYQQLYEYAMANDIVNKDYSEYVKLGENTSNPDRKPFSKDEINLLFETEPNLPQVDTILILIHSGVRPGELLNIKREDIKLDEEYFIVTDSKTEAGQNRLVLIHKKTLPYFKRRFETGTEYLIMHPSKNKQMGYDYYYRSVFQPIMEQLNV